MRVASLSITLLFAVVLAPASAQPPIRKKHDHQMMLALRKTKHLLSKANRDYKGHRVKAIKHIDEAIEHLKKEAQLQGFKGPGPGYKGKEPQWESDKQLHRAIKELRHVHQRLEKELKHTEHRDHARNHIHRAVEELQAALKVKQPRKGKK